MAKQAVTASPAPIPVPSIALRQPVGERVARVTGAASAGEVPSGGGRHAPPMAPDPTVQAAANATRVIPWGNGVPRGAKLDDETPPGAMLTDQSGGSEGAIGAKPAKAAKDRDEPLKLDEEEPAPAAAAAKPEDETPAPAARRSTALANLESERKARELEATVKDLQKKLEAAEPVAKSIREGTLAQKIKALGLSKVETAELLEKLLVKDPELEGSDAPAPAPKKSPEVLALEAKLEALEARLNGRDGNEQADSVRRAEASVAEEIKDVDLPLTHSEIPVTIKDDDGKVRVVTPYNLVLTTAYQMWLDSGKNGHPKDFVKKAGANVEAHLREKYPKAAARLAGQKPTETETEEERPAPRASGPSLGKRTGGAPSSGPKKLSRDRDVRDQEIKREMGWD